MSLNILSFIISLSIVGSSFANSEYLTLSKTLPPSQFLDFPVVSQHEHSMAEALPSYVHQKIPHALIEEAIHDGYTIEIIGAPPSFLPDRSKLEAINIPLGKKSGKQENFYRPSYFYKIDEEKTLVISVMAGQDYIKQYAAMISYFIKQDLGKDPDSIVKVTSFPCLEENIGFWTGLDDHFVKPNDTVLMGNVSDYFDYLQKEGFVPKILEEFENDYYKSSRIQLGSKQVAFLRAKYSFWGDMSARLVKRMLELGASEVVYLSKIATLNDPAHIYKKIYSPTKFKILQGNKIEVVDSPINPIVDKFPELDSGMHISTSNVMEQDFRHTELAKSAATSLDLEVSKIAKVIVEHNRKYKKQVLFTPVHWVTDYLRTEREADLDTGFDLANGDSKTAKVKKKRILERIYHIMTAHLTDANLIAEKR